MTIKELKDYLDKIANENTQVYVYTNEGYLELAETVYVDNEGDLRITT